MTIDELRAARDRRPFRRFVIRLTGGGEVDVEHPENLGWNEHRGDAWCRVGRDGVSCFTLESIVSIEV